jgi:hypothetical protein
MAVSKLLGREYFFSLALCAFLSVVSLGLSALLIEQCMNISKNITTNERLNRSRYSWMNDSLGKPFNHFDRGLIKNTLEFWRFPGYEKDYYQEFCLPSVERKNEKVMDSTIHDDNNAIKRPSINDNGGGDQISGINPSPGSEAGRQLHQSSPPPLNTSPRDINMASPFPTSRKPSVHSRQFNSNPESRQFYGNSEPPPFPNIESTSQEPLDHKKEERRDSQESLIGYQAQNSIYLRQLEAQAQFEVRVQQAIDISNRQPYLNNVSGGSPIEVDHLQGNGITDWNGISRVKRHSQSSKIHTDLESNMSHMSSTESDYSTVNAEIKPSNHDKIPPPQFSGRLSVESSSQKSEKIGSQKSESNSGKYSLESKDVSINQEGVNRESRRSLSQSIQLLQSYQEQERSYIGSSGQGFIPNSPNRQRIPAQHHFDERNQRYGPAKAIDEESMSFMTERTSSDDHSEIEGSFVGNNPNINPR